MKYSFSLPQAQDVFDDRISLSEVLPGVTVPNECKSGRDIVFKVPFASGDRINIGDVLVEIIFYKTNDTFKGQHFDDEIQRYPILCDHSGYIYHQFSGCYTYTIDDLSKPIIVFQNIEDYIDELYPIDYHIKQDEFTFIKSIVWNLKRSDDSDDSDYSDYKESYLSRYLINPGTYIDLNVDKDLPVLILGYSRKQFNIYKRDTISFKFEDGEILHFPVLSNPTNNGALKSQSTVTLVLSVNDIEMFENVSWDKMRIEHFNGDAPVTIDNKYIRCYSEGFASAFFKRYVHEYKMALNELGIDVSTIPKRFNNGKVASSPIDDACYVYLMIDTANGYHKIGISSHPDYREKTLQSEKPSIETICAKRFPSRIIAQSIESALHTAFASKRIRGEWFNLSEKDVEQIVETLR